MKIISDRVGAFFESEELEMKMHKNCLSFVGKESFVDKPSRMGRFVTNDMGNKILREGEDDSTEDDFVLLKPMLIFGIGLVVGKLG